MPQDAVQNPNNSVTAASPSISMGRISEQIAGAAPFGRAPRHPVRHDAVETKCPDRLSKCGAQGAAQGNSCALTLMLTRLAPWPLLEVIAWSRQSADGPLSALSSLAKLALDHFAGGAKLVEIVRPPRLQDSHRFRRPAEILGFRGRVIFVVPPWSHPKIVPLLGLKPPPDYASWVDSISSGTNPF